MGSSSSSSVATRSDCVVRVPATAPPCTRRSRPLASKDLRSRRMVSAVTQKRSARSATEQRPVSLVIATIVDWRPLICATVATCWPPPDVVAILICRWSAECGKLTLKWVYGVSGRGENFSKNLGTALQIIVIYTKIEMILISTPIINV